MWSARQNSFDFSPNARARMTRFRLAMFSRCMRAISWFCVRSVFAFDFISARNIGLLGMSLKRYFRRGVLVC